MNGPRECGRQSHLRTGDGTIQIDGHDEQEGRDDDYRADEETDNVSLLDFHALASTNRTAKPRSNESALRRFARCARHRLVFPFVLVRFALTAIGESQLLRE
jgi:hypothetical protein